MPARIAAPPNPAKSLKDELKAALSVDRQIITGADTYLAIAAPTAAQQRDQVRALTQAVKQLARQNIALGRLVANQLEGTT